MILRRRPPRLKGLSLNHLLPNLLTVLALCSGLTGVRFALAEQWQAAVAAIMVAGVLDGLDGRLARLLGGGSKFGAELDSLSDFLSFGAAPAVIVYTWSSRDLGGIGWTAALFLAVCCALRLARFNARIDADVQPHKSAGFNTGVPAPVGAGLAFAPIYLWLITGNDLFRSWQLVMPWTLFIAVLMISAIPTFSWTSIRIRRSWRIVGLAAVALLAAALINEPWITLLVVSFAYLASVPFSLLSYGRVKRRRAAEAVPTPAG